MTDTMTARAYRALLTEALIAAAPGLLATQDATGRFGTKPWISTDQNLLWPLAAAWALEDAANPHYHDPALLEAIMAGGDALIEEADEEGKWTFRKKDHSTWGQIYQPWTYSRWIRAFRLIREAMPPAREARWARALEFGYTGIARTAMNHLHNIPTHHAMGLYCAGEVFGREEWKAQSREFMAKILAKQSPDGWWSEHVGPVIMYGAVYVDSLGHYYAMSRDAAVLEALRRAARFHALLTYPDGSAVETVDERNTYRPGAFAGNVGFTFTPEGRAFLARQLALRQREGKAPDADYAASLLFYGEPLDEEAAPAEAGRRVLGDGDALLSREGAWFSCLSAFTAPPLQSRWIQDRQNYLSLYHDRLGVVLGGGNTKLQPLWSTFTVGDPALLAHTPGDEDPNFTPDIPLRWCADVARLTDGDAGLDLAYGDEACALRLRVEDDARAVITVTSACRTDAAVEAHLTLLPRGETVTAASGQTASLGPDAFAWSAEEAGGRIEHAGLTVTLPPGARLVWPAVPHDPYVKDGFADHRKGRLVVCVPLTPARPTAEVEIRVEE